MRTIDLTITNEFVKGAGAFVGAAGSHDDVYFRMTFGDMWDGLAKTIVWRNAYRDNPTFTVVTAAYLEDMSVPNVYLVPIPTEAKQYPGLMGMTIRGAEVEDQLETEATLTVYAEFVVKESHWSDDAAAAADVTPTQAVQLQDQIEDLTNTLLTSIAKTDELQDAWDNLEVDAETLAAGEPATVEKTQTDVSVKFTFGIPAGRDGAASNAEGLFYFIVDERGHLILTYVSDEELEFEINDQGHLIVSFED